MKNITVIFFCFITQISIAQQIKSEKLVTYAVADSAGVLERGQKDCYAGVFDYDSETVYTEEGLLSDIIYYDTIQPVYKFTYIYNHQWALMTSSVYFYDLDSITKWEKNYYDDEHRIIKKELFDHSFGLDSYIKYEYQGDSMILENKFTSDSTFVNLLISFYDGELLLEQYDSNAVSGGISTRFYSYDEKGLVIRKQYSFYYDDGALFEQLTTFTYNDKGYMQRKNLMEASTSPLGKKEVSNNVYTFMYAYDRKGNWIKRITYENEIPIDWEELIIQYYD